MKALKIILIVIASLIAIVLVLGLIAPKKFHVERSAEIKAPAEIVLNTVKSLKAMDSWSPWAELDPNMKVEFSGTDGEVGSVSSWEGNEQVGKGSQEITAISENRVDVHLKFIEPFESESMCYYQISSNGDVTSITWGMDGDHDFPFNALMMFMNMDAALGADFEKGLAKLKTLLEAKASEKKPYNGYEIKEVELPAKMYIGKKDSIGWDKIGEFFSKHFPVIFDRAGKSGIQPAGAPSGLFYKWNEDSKSAVMAAAIPVAAEAKPIKDYEAINLPAGKALHIAYYGAYEKSENAHMAMDEYIKDKGFTQLSPVLEEYITDPMSEPDTAKWLTNIYYYIQ
jgi:effector-binding domain-containing protein